MVRARSIESKRFRVLVIHGPNLNLLGTREPEIYGRISLARVNESIRAEARALRAQVTVVQSNHEGKLVDVIGGARKRFDGILINPAAYTHTSVALRDALSASGIPAVEVHLSHIYGREAFRRESLTAPVCAGAVSGFGETSYLLGLRGLIEHLRKNRP
jgi:3-dehydroquinate dehydratase-2